ncbi:zinc finger CCCH domain-containing protein 13-like isoform X1 [Haliotis asinina]|uniref:zinc finger CCCH domain-containing protein 13-like isoform X1 n=1 Tax=Haliotis asinina TaxID=109174 RepID=UPI003531EE4F
MSKPRRRVTVDTGKPVSEESEKRKPSVFERLGPGGGQRKYEERGEKSKSQSQSLYLDKCRHWLLTGNCPFGAKCKFQHGPFIAKRPTKNRSDDDGTDDLRLKVKGSTERHHPEGSVSPESRSGSRSRHDKETKIKSTVVVKNTTGGDSGDEDSENSDNWDAEVLDYKKELELEKKRQEIQRALSQLAASEGEERENITIEKKVPSKEKIARESVSFTLKKNRPEPTKPFSSDYSDSESSPERTKTLPKKSPKKTSPPSKKKGDKKKHKQKSPVGKTKGPLRSPSPADMGKHKEHKKKYDTEDDSPHKTKHKKMKKMDKKLERSPEPDLPKSKKKHSPRIDKFHTEKPSKADKRLLSPDLGSPTGKRSHRSWSPTSKSRSRSRSITPIPTKKQKNISPKVVKEKVKGEKVKQKKKKGKNKLGGDGSAARERHISPVRIKKKKIKAELPFPIKRDIEEDLPARHSDSPGSENMPPRSMSPGSPRRKEPLEREFFKGMLHDREEEKRETGNRKNKRKRSETPPQRERIPPSRSDIVEKRKGGQSQERKFSRKEQYNADIDRPKHSDDRGRRASPDSFRSEDRSPTPTPPSRRNHSPDEPQRSRSRRGRDDDFDVNRSRDRRTPDERRMGKESRERRDDLDPRGQSRESYRERYEHGEEHRRDPRERFEEGFQEFPDRYQERSRFPDERDPYDPRERHRHDQSFERGRDNRRERYEGRDRLAADQSRMHQGREYFGDRHQGMHGMGRGTGRGRGAYEAGMRERGYVQDRQEQMRGYPPEFADRQSRRSEWEDRRRGEVFGQGRDWGERHDMQHDERFDMRRDDHRFDERGFRRDDDRPIGRDGRPLSRGNEGRSIDRNMRDNWRDRPDVREDRMGMRDERMRDTRMDDRRRERHSPSPYDKRYRDDRFPHDDRMFGREDEDRMRDERMPMERGRDDRMRDTVERDRDVRGGMDRGRDDRGMIERDRGPMDRARDGSVDERGRGNRGRDDRGREDRMGLDRGREERGPLDRMKEDRGSLDRGEDRGFMDERRRERGFREDRKGERGARDERGFRDEEDRFRDDRGFREDSRGGKFERDFREERVGRDERHRDDREFRGSRGDPSPEDDRTPDHRTREEKEDQEKASRDGSPKDERPRSSSSKSERAKDKMSKDDRNSDKSSKDSRMSKDEKSSKDDRWKEDRSKEKGERRRREDRSPRRDREDRSPKRDGKKEEKGKWPPREAEEQDSEAESGEDLKVEETRSRDSRKRGHDKEGLPLSPIPKRLRDISPASSSRSRGSHNSRRHPDREQQRSRRRGDSGSDRDDKSVRKGSVDRDKKSRKKDGPSIDAPCKSGKSRSVSPKPSKEKSEDKAEKGKARRRSLSGSSSRSKEGAAPPDSEEKSELPSAAPRKADDNLYDEDNISAIVSLGGKSSLADDDRASDHASIRSVQFSDWSEDDMADNILNQAEVEIEREERRQRSPSRSSLGSRGSAHDRKTHAGQDHMLEAIKERAHGESSSMVTCEGEDSGQDKDGQFDEDMEALPEYEQISSDEDGFMEDDGEVQPSIVNILDIDWSSLKEEAKPKPKGSALKRFSPASIFSQIGVSRAYAGDELFEKIKTVCQKQLDESEKTENDGADSDKEKPSQKFVLHDSVAAFHCAALRKLRERASLLKNIGSHRRALCARKDLEIRRRLCKVDKVFDQSPVYPSHVMDTDLSKLSIQLFRQGRDITPDKKEPETEIKTEVSCST